MSDFSGEKLSDSEKKDAYYQNVLEIKAADLIIRDRKDKKDPDKVDEKANMEATRANLSNEADRLSKLIAEQCSSIPVSKDCNQMLKEARDLISKVNLDHEAVLMKMDEIKCRLLRAYDSRELQPRWFLGLGALNFLWLIIIGGLIWWKMLIPGQDSLQQIGLVALACALWGGVGGVVDAFFALHTHFSKQEFDKRYRPWYILHPILGLSLGAIIFLIIQAGLMATTDIQLKETPATTNITSEVPTTNEVARSESINIEVTGDTVTNGEINGESTNEDTGGVPAGGTVLPIAIAFLAGFKQSSAIDFISRIVKSIFQKENE